MPHFAPRVHPQRHHDACSPEEADPRRRSQAGQTPVHCISLGRSTCRGTPRGPRAGEGEERDAEGKEQKEEEDRDKVRRISDRL